MPLLFNLALSNLVGDNLVTSYHYNI